MKVVNIMYDTLCRHFLSPYGNKDVKTPNFDRLAQNAVTFDNSYVCSLPCMPARRDLHNSRANFLQRDWGPLEPFDDSVPEMLKSNGIFSALVSDHGHYWEDGGATYHTRYFAWIGHRGQEGDPCNFDRRVVSYAQTVGKNVPWYVMWGKMSHIFDEANRDNMPTDDLMPQALTFADGLKFLDDNHDIDNWYLQIETFDPHEPFFTHDNWKELYPEIAKYKGNETDWPKYEPVADNETDEDIAYVRWLYAALVSMCDHYLGKVLDLFDKYDLWKDTMLVVNTDHGFLLGEHGWWAKSTMPAYEEISHTPLFIYDPISKIKGERREGLVSTIDIPATILDFFGISKTPDMQGNSILPLIRENKKIRDRAIFGFNCAHVAVTDGEYVYFRAPLASEERNCYEYTLMPTRMRGRFDVETLKKAEFVGPLPLTKGCKVLKTPAPGSYVSSVNFGTKFFNVKTDPRQRELIDDAELEAKYANMLAEELIKAQAPDEQFVRLGLKASCDMTAEDILAAREEELIAETPTFIEGASWTKAARNIWRNFSKMMPPEGVNAAKQVLIGIVKDKKEVTENDIVTAVKLMLPEEQRAQSLYFLRTLARTE